MLELATEIEGHPDNAAAALLGGFVVSAAIDGSVESARFDVPRDLRCVVFIPELRLLDQGDAGGPARDRPARRRGRQPRAASPWGSPASPADGSTCSAS